jgi:hypothetical protein
MGKAYSDASTILNDILSLPSCGSQPPAQLLEILSAMAQPYELTKLLLSISEDDEAIAACAERSFRHPLGFSKLTLINVLPLFQLRAHVWWPGNWTGVDHIHNHRFSLVSSVVHGTYEMQMYEDHPAGLPMTEYREEVSRELGWRLQYVSTTRIRSLATIRLQQGTSYILPAETLHRVTVMRVVPCVTLFLQTMNSRSTTNVFINQGDPIPVEAPKEPYSSNGYRRQLESLLAVLRSLLASIIANLPSIGLRYTK